jgi:hypothetical protein
LLSDPIPVIEGLARWFAIPLSTEDLLALPRVMERSAKRPMGRYDGDAYDRDIASILDRHAEEVSRALLYGERLRARAPIPAVLPQPLVCP